MDERYPTGREFSGDPVPIRVGVVIEGLRERVMVRLPCVCGGAIRASRFEPTPYVAAHNRSSLHREWRAETGR